MSTNIGTHIILSLFIYYSNEGDIMIKGEEFIKNSLNSISTIFDACSNINQKEEMYKIICEFKDKIDLLRIEFYKEFSENHTWCEKCNQWKLNTDFNTETFITTGKNKTIEKVCLVCKKCGFKKVIRTNTTIYMFEDDDKENKNVRQK